MAGAEFKVLQSEILIVETSVVSLSCVPVDDSDERIREEIANFAIKWTLTDSVCSVVIEVAFEECERVDFCFSLSECEVVGSGKVDTRFVEKAHGNDIKNSLTDFLEGFEDSRLFVCGSFVHLRLLFGLP